MWGNEQSQNPLLVHGIRGNTQFSVKNGKDPFSPWNPCTEWFYPELCYSHAILRKNVDLEFENPYNGFS